MAAPSSAAGAFHAGEQALQDRVGLRERLAEIAPVVLRDHMPDQHRELFEKLPTLLLGSLDSQGLPWATMLAGQPGFVSTPDARAMRLAIAPDADDPALAALAPGAPVGVLGLEPHTRRRNRMNGRVRAFDKQQGLAVAVEQSFGNCPKYIQARRPEPQPPGVTVPLPVWLGPGLDAAARALIARSDTLFIASASASRPEGGSEQGVDVSHRGGEPGFVRLAHDETGSLVLSLPDYPGNQFFNTLGNLSLFPQAGLLFVDYEGGGLLQLQAEAELLWDDEAARACWPGAQRVLRLRVHRAVWRAAVLPWRWSAPEPAAQFGALRAQPG
ncbi:pyridoxamine 5'-phosphate oxidase family protein [Paucibacter sp. PLA-PC-4]|uniref:pyridoxamine 5'-phosphate oxidase family protein n=1 Tax=Paucibacter sp. PLA-PC-4 TaxID=2993655 RepID=UPI00224B0FDC|nr:pyridoxamine 5'-phosphate oxidase family protein [Paucibacter sp. PLA-PC-4]MCX2864840.1 pyridoxamine 5'-phosphate oxidase family protein [Paucibacter sp. PLA-PC-4]